MKPLPLPGPSEPPSSAPPASAPAVSAPVAPTPRVRAIQRTALGMLVLAGVINYVDRATLSVANPAVRADLGLSVREMGWLLSAFLWAYAFAQLPVGALVDRLGPRRLLGAGLAVWSAAQGLAGLVRGFGQFYAARLLLGLGEAPQFPTGARVTRDWFSARHRGIATGIFNCASSLGTAISMPLLTFLMLWVGWRGMFMLMGAAGLAVAILWYAVYRDPAQCGLTAEEDAYRHDGDPPDRTARLGFAEWRALFRYRTTWGMIGGYFGTIYLTWVYTAWLPGYLEIERHMSVRGTGFAAAVPFACGVVGSLFGGWFADWLMRRGAAPMASRQWPAAAALVGTAACTVAAALVASNALAIAFISAALFLVYVTSTCAWALSSVAVPTNCTASIGAMQNFGGYLGGALAPTVTGEILARTGSFTWALVAGAAIGVVSALSYLLVVDRAVSADDMDAALGRPATDRTERSR